MTISKPIYYAFNITITLAFAALFALATFAAGVI